MQIRESLKPKVRVVVEVDYLDLEEKKPIDKIQNESFSDQDYTKTISQLTFYSNEELWELVAKSREILRQRGEITD